MKIRRSFFAGLVVILLGVTVFFAFFRRGDAVSTYGAATIDYKRAGKPRLKVELGEPVVVAVANKPERWGFFQFPMISRQADGTVLVKWSMRTDGVTAYGKPGSGLAVSRNDGKTWDSYRREMTLVQRETGAVADVTLPNGDRLEIVTPEAIKIDSVRLPRPLATTGMEHYTKEKLLFYRLNELPPELQGVYLKRLPKGAKEWVVEHATVEDPRALRYSLSGVIPIVWWGDIRVAGDGSLIAATYPGYYVRDDGSADPKMNVFTYRSTDNGRSWKIQGRIFFQPNLKVDPLGEQRWGFCDPALEALTDGSFLCVMRTTDGSGIAPLYASRSTDLGVTWSKSEVIAPNGVQPRLLQLANGVLVLSSGRPGLQLRFSTDGQGQTWSDPFEMLPYDSSADLLSSTCGSSGLLATGPDRFLMVYADFKHMNTDNEPRKAIKAREVRVTRN